MFSPRITVEGGHIPAGGTTTSMGGATMPATTFGQWQPRAGLSWSPLDFVRGFMMLDASDHECAAVTALARAQHVIGLGAEVGELAARRSERDALVAARPSWEAVVARTQTRVGQGLATEPELTSVRAEAERLARRIDALDAEIARLVAAGHEDDSDAATLRTELSSYEEHAMALERQQSSIRRLQPWSVTVIGSYVPVQNQVQMQDPVTMMPTTTAQYWTSDWFGWVTLSYNLGGIAQAFAEDDAVSARAAELGADANELRHGFERFERLLSESLAGLRADLEHVERQIEIQTHQRELLGQLETSEVENLRAMIDLQVIALEAERAHLARLIEVRAALSDTTTADTTTGTDDGH